LDFSVLPASCINHLGRHRTSATQHCWWARVGSSERARSKQAASKRGV